MEPLDTITTEYKGFTIRVNVHPDYNMGEPWKEHDGHGIVSDWEGRDKRPGELVLNSDGRSKRFYDFAATMKKAKSEGWGLGDKDIAKLQTKLGRKPTNGDILHASVMQDYEFLKGWCNDEWHWVGYVTEVFSPDGWKLETEHDSCWGFEGTDDGIEYMIEEAQDNAQGMIDRHLAATAKEQAESALMACRDIATV